MSCNRENISWRSGKDGKWYIGFYNFYYTNEESEDFDFEWDVEYDFTRFNWASGPHDTLEEAEASWKGANPGIWAPHMTIDETSDKCDRMFQECVERQKTNK